MKNKIFAVTALFMALTVFVSCGKSKGEQAIDLVKNGTWPGYESETIGEAVSKTFTNPLFGYTEKEDGSVYVFLEGTTNGEGIIRKFLQDYPDSKKTIETFGYDNKEDFIKYEQNYFSQKFIFVFETDLKNKKISLNSILSKNYFSNKEIDSYYESENEKILKSFIFADLSIYN